MRKLKNNELGRKSVNDFKKAHKLPVVIVLDNVRSLNNVGSIFRTADAFLLQEIHLCGITATPPHNEIHKTALGAEDSMRWTYFENTLDAVKELKQKGFAVFAIEQAEDAQMLDTIDFFAHKKLAFVLGNEVKGVKQEVVNHCDGCIEIPQFGTKHSLNVSISGGMVIWQAYLRFRENLQ